MSMEPYHRAWLAVHPDRTEGWLRDRLAEGFDVHHLDGDHGNDEPGNLVLIEHLDHMRIHDMPGNRLVALGRTRSVKPDGWWKETAQNKSAKGWAERKRAVRNRKLNAIELMP